MKTGFEEGLAAVFQHLSGAAPTRRTEDVGRNDPCPCGSQKKYKKCCLRNGKVSAVRRGPADLEAFSSELAPRIGDESTFARDLQLLGMILLPIPEAALDPQQIERFLDEEDLDPTVLVTAPDEDFDEVAIRFCRTHVEVDHWEKVARALVAKVPFHLDSTDHLRAILTGLVVLENRRKGNLVGIMLFRDGVLNYLDDMVGSLVQKLGDQKARPFTELGTLLQDVVESRDGQRLTRLLQDSAAGQALSARLGQDLDTAYQEVSALMASGDFPVAPPWPVRLVAMQCTTERVLDLLNDTAGAEDGLVGRLQDRLHEDDLRLVATEIDRWLASHDEHPHRMEMKQMALLCHTRTMDVLVTWALCTMEELNFSFASSLEEEVVLAGTNASVDEVEALACAYDDWGYPAIADRIRHHQLEVFENMAAAADSAEARATGPDGEVDRDSATGEPPRSPSTNPGATSTRKGGRGSGK